MKKLLQTLTKNFIGRSILCLSILGLPFPLYSQYTLTYETGYAGIYDSEYINDMYIYWDINVGADKFLVLNYSLGLSEYSSDYINIYTVDQNGSQYLIGSFSGIESGEIRTAIPSGRARIELVTDYYDSYYNGFGYVWGFEVYYYTDNDTEYAPENLDVKYTTQISGNLEVGTRTPNANSQMLVKGKIKARNVEMTTNGWADFVFDSDYKLPTLTEIDEYIGKHKHLPGIPSAVEVKEKGINVSEIQMKLLQKIEELTLYVIQHQKDLDALK